VTTPEPRVQVTRYTVNCLPEDSSPDAHVFEVTIQYCGNDLWAVTRHHQSLGVDGQWSWGPQWPADNPGSREPLTDAEHDAYRAARDEWTTNHRHHLGTALRLAREAARHITVNGLTPVEALARLTQLATK